MGRKKKNKTKAAKVQRQQQREEHKEELTTEQLCEHAEQALTRFKAEVALELCERAVEQEPDNLDAIDLRAQCLMELGRGPEATEWLLKSTQLAPLRNPENWMSLGQLHQGSAALECFQKGLEVMTTIKEQGKSMCANDDEDEEEEEEEDDIDRRISSAWCAIAELYTTDLCDEPIAEAECERALELAIATHEANPEGHYGRGNLRLIQGRVDEAIESAQRCIELLTQDEVPEWCPYEFRLTVAKLALELNLFPSVVQVLERLLREDDRFVEVWYLSGIAYQESGEILCAFEYLKRAMKMINKALGLANEDDEEQQNMNPLEMAMGLQVEGEENELTQLRLMVQAALCKIPKEALAKAQEEVANEPDESEGNTEMT